MAKLSDEAFAIMAVCEETKKQFGISVDPRGSNTYAFCWSFKIKEGQAAREGFDKTHVRGSILFERGFNGCPHCGSKNFYICQRCGKVVCYHDQEYVTCPNCGMSSTLQAVEEVDLKGGGF